MSYLKRGDLVMYTEEYRGVAYGLWEQIGIFLYSEPWIANKKDNTMQGFFYWPCFGKIQGIILERKGEPPVFKVLTQAPVVE